MLPSPLHQPRNSPFEPLLPRRLLLDLDLSELIQFFSKTPTSTRAVLHLRQVYSLGARRTPAAPHTTHEPFTPCLILTVVLCHAIVQAVVFTSFESSRQRTGSVSSSSSSLRREDVRPRVPRPRSALLCF